MSLFDFRWTTADLFRTLFDRTPQLGGFLVPQDDLPAANEPPFPTDIPPEVLADLAELPYDVLDNVVSLTDFRQRARTNKQKRGRTQGTRPLAQVTALWLHQTAAMLGSPERFLSVPVQGAVDTRAGVTLLHPLRAYMYAAHHANRFSVSIEVACRAAGIEGDPRTFWRSGREKNGYERKGRWIGPKSYSELVHEATDDQLEATRHLVSYYIHEAERQAQIERAMGKNVPGIIAIGVHRNSKDNRSSDPGSRINQEIVQWAIREFDLVPGPIVGSGRPSPRIWTGTGDVRYSGRVSGW